jgi:hypothetical protein
MIWLRHELWEYPDGLGYRLAGKAETDRLAAASPGGHLRHVFYAPSPAAAEAQYCALRGIGPYIVNPTDSEEPFTMAQLLSQLADFPDDERLARQPALPQPEGGHPPIAVPAVAPAHGHGHDHPETHGDHPDAVAAHPADAHEHADAASHDDHAPAAARPSAEPDPAPAEAHAPGHAPAHTDEPASHAPEPVTARPAAPSSSEIDALGPITVAPRDAPAPARRRRKPNAFLGVLRLIVRLVMLLIILGAVIIGVGIATGTWDAPTVLARARALPEQVRDSSIVRSLLPSA